MIAGNPPEKELLDSTTCLALVEEVAASSQLKRAARLQQLLRYVSRRALIEGCDQIREQEIGAAVFERPDGYDTSIDTIVRVSASELRKRIDAYFNSEGMHQKLIMEIPRGNYIPVFRNRPDKSPITAESPVPPVAPAVDQHENLPAAQPASGQHRWMIALVIVSILAIGGCAALWIQNHNLSVRNRALDGAINDWRYQPVVAALWSGFLDSNRVTDVVMSDESLLLLQYNSKHLTTFDDYLSGSFLSQFLDKEPDAQARSVLNSFGSRILASPNELRLAMRIVTLDPLNKQVHIYDAREYNPGLLKEDNVILLGTRTSNPWAELFDKNLNFSQDLDDHSAVGVINRAPKAGEQSIYRGDLDIGYCVVAYMPNPDSNGKLLLIQGTSADATQAAGEFILSDSQLSNFLKRMHVEKLPYFEVLLKTSQVKGTPFTATVEAFRAYPNLH